MKNKRGSVLLYTLALFMSVILFIEAVVSHKIMKAKREQYRSIIELRLDFQQHILSTYRSECDFKHPEEDSGSEDDDDEFDEDLEDEFHEGDDESRSLCRVSFEFNEETYLIEGDAFQFEVLNGYGLSILKYDIMIDGSVIETITEELI